MPSSRPPSFCGTHGPPAPYGAQLAPLDRIRTRLAAAMPADAFDQAAAAGAALSRKQTAEVALTAVDALGPA